MKTSTGFEPCYNGQLAVDGEFQIIVANHQGNNASDNGYLVLLLDEVETTLGGQSGQCLADAGYRKEENLQAFEEKSIDGYVSLRREGEGGVQNPTRPGMRTRHEWPGSWLPQRGGRSTLSASTWSRL